MILKENIFFRKMFKFTDYAALRVKILYYSYFRAVIIKAQYLSGPLVTEEDIMTHVPVMVM